MTWWGWIIGGAILLGAELSFVNAHFYLVFVGSAAIAVGLLTAALPNLAPWAQWALFALLAIVTMLAFRSRLYQHYHHGLPRVASGPTGGVITLPVALPPGATCQAEHGGSYWTVQNDSDSLLAPGTRVRIVRVRDLTLLVRPEA
jgi:inner membrane protein